MSTLKVDTIKSDTTSTVTVSDGLSVTGSSSLTGDVTTAGINLTGELNFTGNGHKYIDVATLNGGHSLSIRHQDGGSYETGLTLDANGASKLFHNGVQTFATLSDGIHIQGPEGGAGLIKLSADEGDDNADNWLFQANTDGTLDIKNLTDGSWDVNIKCTGDGAVDLYHNDTKMVETTSSGMKVPIASSGHGITIDAASNNVYPQLTFNANRSAENNSIGYIRGQWNSTDVVAIDFVAGPDTSNKDDGHIKFQTRPSGGGVTERLRITSLGLVRVPDGGKFVCGNADDLYIHHTSGVNHVRSGSGNLVIGTDANNMVILGAYYNAGGGGDTCEVWGGANFLPATNDAIDLGETNHKWDDIYATNGTIQTSDQNNKDNIATSDLGLSFIDKLSPKSYKFKGKTRTHYGLIAQDVETVLSDISKATSDFAGFIKTDAPVQLYNERDEAHNRIPSGKAIGDVKLAAHTDYGLRYGEFIGPLIKAVQELSAKVTALESA